MNTSMTFPPSGAFQRPMAFIAFFLAITIFAVGIAFATGNTIAERLIADTQQRLNLTHDQAVGLVGNLAHESGNFNTLQEIDPVVEGSRGGWGYAQWTASRRVAFERYANANGYALDSYEANLEFLVYEMNTTHSNALRALQGADGVDAATRAVMATYLIPGVPHYDSRLGYAQAFANGDFSGSGIPGPGSIYGSGFLGYEPLPTPIETYIPDALMPWTTIQNLGAIPPGAAY